jgi:hypothetical protein
MNSAISLSLDRRAFSLQSDLPKSIKSIIAFLNDKPRPGRVVTDDLVPIDEESLTPAEFNALSDIPPELSFSRSTHK